MTEVNANNYFFFNFPDRLFCLCFTCLTFIDNNSLDQLLNFQL